MTVALASLSLLAGSAQANSCSSHELVFAISTSPGHLLADGTMGMRQSDDGGKTWKAATLPLSSPPLITKGAQFQYGANDGEVYRSVDAGRTWKKIGSEFSALATGENGEAYACSMNGELLYRFNPSTHQWDRVGRVDKSGQLVENNELIYLDYNGRKIRGNLDKRWWSSNKCNGLTVRGATMYTMSGGAVLRSTDRGRHWHGKYDGEYHLFDLHVGARGILYAHLHRKTDQLMQVLQSRDHGASWTALDFPALHGKPARVLGTVGADVYLVVTEPATVLAKQTRALYRLRSNRLEKLIEVEPHFRGDAFFHIADQRSFLLTTSNRILSTRDAGATWTVIEGSSLTSAPWQTCTGDPPRESPGAAF